MATANVATLRPEEVTTDAAGAPVWGATALHFAKCWAEKYDIVAVQEHRIQWEGVAELGPYSIAMSAANHRGTLGCAILWKADQWNLQMHENAGPRAAMVVLRKRQRAVAVISLHLPTQQADEAELDSALKAASVLRAKVRRMKHVFFMGDMNREVIKFWGKEDECGTPLHVAEVIRWGIAHDAAPIDILGEQGTWTHPGTGLRRNIDMIWKPLTVQCSEDKAWVDVRAPSHGTAMEDHRPVACCVLLEDAERGTVPGDVTGLRVVDKKALEDEGLLKACGRDITRTVAAERAVPVG